MPTPEFFESYPLHKKFRTDPMPNRLNRFGQNAIHVPCESGQCEGAVRTFRPANRSRLDGTADPGTWLEGSAFVVCFTCAACQTMKGYLLEFGPMSKGDTPESRAPAWVRKVGEWPQRGRDVPKDVERALGEKYEGLYRKGFECEGEGFGVGALAYYRRIVEDFVRGKLDEVEATLVGEEQAAFRAAAEKVRRQWSGSEAIDLIKDKLPQEARPDGHNPLAILYSDLSDGLHAKLDEECAALAGGLRELLSGFFLQLQRTREAESFAEKVKEAHKRRSGGVRDVSGS